MKTKILFLLPIFLLSLSGCALNLSGPEGPDSGEEVSLDEPSGPDSREDADNQSPDSGEDQDNQGPDSGEEVNIDESSGPDSGEDADNQGPDSGEDQDNQGPDSGEEIDTNEPSGPDSGEDEDNQGPDSGEEINLFDEAMKNSKGSCDIIGDSSTCVSYVGSYWNDNNMKLHCQGGGTFSKKSCPADSLGGCKSGVGTPNENVIWHYGRGGQPFDGESIGYASKSCASVPGMAWVSR